MEELKNSVQMDRELQKEFNDLIEELSALNRQVDKMRVQSFKIQARITEIINGSSLEFVRKICK